MERIYRFTAVLVWRCRRHRGLDSQMSCLLCLESGSLCSRILVAGRRRLPEFRTLLVEMELLVDLLLMSPQLGNLLITKTVDY